MNPFNIAHCSCTEEELPYTLYEDGLEVEYTAYCKECGTYLYTFCYGHKEY